MRKTLTALLLALSAGGASAQYIDVIEMLQAPPSGGGVTLDRNTSTLTIEKPGSVPPMSENVPHKVDGAGIGIDTGPDTRGTPIGK
ncbi:MULTISPECIES: hypothetical protein [Mameliella]|uniref:hypothetical protein n=1 Tax=Mameliella TaxID=1434019 RepID=UPI0008410499|nr:MULTISPECIES: hypothetical protein [Mameliella]ODM49056.1 hypothetical protein A9320_17460 [Ruegeria sp. PBVC088]MBY6118329.1 hypothetical protein [Mameliella alba]MDD9731159.1 hypothetical protein [Mameliella sp. AT18]OWV43391.1 hypothetical protein CDZ95_11460 [Mameliella alba]OWV68528.1 hypothetical protein CDZ97_01815 [Mameliella alba]